MCAYKKKGFVELFGQNECFFSFTWQISTYGSLAVSSYHSSFLGGCESGGLYLHTILSPTQTYKLIFRKRNISSKPRADGSLLENIKNDVSAFPKTSIPFAK